MAKIKWGIIGCGNVTEVKSGPAFYKAADSVLTAVMRRNAEKAEDYAKRHNVPKWYSEADKLIDDPDVDAVYIATPPGSHCEHTLKVAEAGKPVYVEKPMAINHDQCQKMVEACDRGGVPLFVAYYRRTLPNHLKVKELVDDGVIGDIRFINIKIYMDTHWETDLGRDQLPWRVLPEVSGGGYFFDLASHQFDFMDFVFGPITDAHGQVANQAAYYPAEDIVAANFRFESNIIGTGLWCFTVSAANKIEETEIIGSKGRISFASFGPAVVRVETEAGTEEFLPEMPQHVHQPLVQTVVDELLGRGQCPSTGVSGARTSRIMDEIVKGWQE